MVLVKEEKSVLAKKNEELKAELNKVRCVDEEKKKEIIANPGANNDTATVLQTFSDTVNVLEKELDSVKVQLKKNDEYVKRVNHENKKFRCQLDRMTHVLNMRNVELDYIHGRLNASRYYINYLQNRPEFQSIPKNEVLPPDMRRSSSRNGHIKPKKKVHFGDVDIRFIGENKEIVHKDIEAESGV